MKKSQASVVEIKAAPKAISEPQRRWLLKNGVAESDIPATSFEAMKLMDKFIAKQKRSRAEPPTEFQLNCLEEYGYNRQAMRERTKGFCSSLIHKLKKQNNELKAAQ